MTHLNSKFLSIGSLSLAGLLLLPLMALFSYLFVPITDSWSHLIDTVLLNYISNSIWLIIGVGIGVFFVGTTTAWLVCMHQFPGKRLLEWALILPIAVPTYVMAYTYSDLLQFVGPVQEFIREMTGWQHGDYWFPQIRSLGGAIFVFIFLFYPYVYLLARSAFYEQSVCVLEVSRSLGAGPFDRFFRVALPMARPAIVAGIALAIMESLADFGAVSYFGLQTFTTGIYRSWYSMGDPSAATGLSLSLLVFVGLLIYLERRNRQQAQYHQTTCRYRTIPNDPMPQWAKYCATIFCSLPIIFGFFIPIMDLVFLLVEGWDLLYFNRFWHLASNSFVLALVTALCATIIALFLAYALRVYKKNKLVKFSISTAGLGYAIPGTIIAVGTLIPFAWVDNTVDSFFRSTFGISTGLLLTGSMFVLVFAYLIRFLTISLQTVSSSLQKVTPNMDSAAHSLGATGFSLASHIHIPIVKGSLLTAILIVFVEVMKELPATLLLRPFNMDTLAIRAYQLASDERLAEAALPSLAILLVGFIPVYILTKNIANSRPGHCKKHEPLLW